MGVQLVITDRLPEKIATDLENLMETYPKQEVVAAMKPLLPRYRGEYEEVRGSWCGSGMAAEVQMAVELRYIYLKNPFIF